MAVVQSTRNMVEDDLDDLDALFADKSLEEILRNQDEQDAREKARSGKGAGRNLDLAAVDEDIKITKRRAPNAKLDELRLLSSAGISKIQKISRVKPKFRGKGHELSDVALLLRIYQLWLDDLYPKAKFADALSMIEKLGHTKTMQMHRKRWLSEARYGHQEANESNDADPEQSGVDSEPRRGDKADNAQITSIFGAFETLDPLNGSETAARGSNGPSMSVERDQPDEDELDALLAEHEQHTSDRTENFDCADQAPQKPNKFDHLDDFADDEEALRDMDLDPPW